MLEFAFDRHSAVHFGGLLGACSLLQESQRGIFDVARESELAEPSRDFDMRSADRVTGLGLAFM
jgi:hypothetical protein